MSPEEPKLPENQASEGRPPSLIHNWISVAGIGISAFIFANLLFLLLLSFSGIQNPYLGVLAYLVFPAVALFALLLIPVGMLRERRRRRTLEPSISQYPRLDLNTRAGWQAFARAGHARASAG